MQEGISVEVSDVSVANLIVNIGGVHVVDWMDEGNPIEFSDADVTNIEWSCNGRMIRTVKPSAVMVSVSVIPGSTSDLQLYELWRRGFCNGGNVSGQDDTLSGSISFAGGSLSYRNGTCVSGPAGVSTGGPVKLRGNTYTFAFEQVN